MPALPDWLTPLPDAEQMRAIDRWAIEQQGVPGLDLMERAGEAVARAAERLAADGTVAVVCGKGNNGGDGLVAARVLRESGRAVTVLCTAPPGELLGDVRTNLERLPGPAPLRLDGTPWEQVAGEGGGSGGDGALPLAGAAVIVDALLGTGFEGQPRGPVLEAIEAINGAARPVVSVDTPSGVDASSGAVLGAAVRASATVTFHAAKPGLWIQPGKGHVGELQVAEIGIPRGAPLEASVGLIEPRVLALLPRRRSSWTKFRSGHVVIAGGSRGLTGAPRMSALASMRAGAGYVTLCVPASLQAILATGSSPEIMTRGLPDENGSLLGDGVADVLEVGERAGALALGPGLGRSSTAFSFARTLACEARLPLVLDADGLNAHAGRLGELRARDAPAVLTPHAGELGRLLETSSSQIERERLRHVREAARESGTTVLLKGDDTLIADPAGSVAVSAGGTAALATAGTGDVLTGVIAALLAQGLDAFAAAAAGVWLHAAAGREAARRLGIVEGVIASDVIEALPAARARAVADGAHAAAHAATPRPGVEAPA